MDHSSNQKHRCRHPKRVSVPGGRQMPPEKVPNGCSEPAADAAVEPQKRGDTDRGMSLQGGGEQCQNQ